MALPDVYLIGAPKSGTTSVASWLAQHPQVYWSVPKEPFYWASDYPRMRRHHGFVTRNDYEELFSSQGAREADIRAEGSTTYLYSSTAVPAILKAVPHARFIVCVRNPADLLVSWHRTQLVTMNESEPDFGRAWRRSLAGRLPDTDLLDPKLLDYPMVGGLGAAVARLFSTVERDRVHIVVLDDLREDPGQVWTRLAEFMGIDPAARPDLRARNASDKAIRFRALQHVLLRPPQPLAPAVRGLRQWSRTSRLPGVRSARALLWRHEKRPTASALDRNAVLEHFEPDIELLSGLLGRDLSAWTTRIDETSMGEVGSL
jgi:Sulfotransferase domain